MILRRGSKGTRPPEEGEGEAESAPDFQPDFWNEHEPEPVSEGTTEEQKQEDKDKEVKYFLVIQTENQRTRLATDGKDQLWIFGQVQCNDPKVDAESLTRALSFQPAGVNASWLQLGEPQMTTGYNAVLVRARPPGPDAELQSGATYVWVGTQIEGKTVSGNVPLELEPELYVKFL
jgi:hypothetical protein